MDRPNLASWRRGKPSYRLRVNPRLWVVAALVCITASCGNERNGHHSAKTIPASRGATVTMGRPGDHWVDTMQFVRVARAQRDSQYGYEVTYEAPGGTTLTLFWSRDQIDLRGGLPNYRLESMPFGDGRLLYPDKLTQESLPNVFQAIQIIEDGHARDADGAITAAEMFGVVAALGGAAPAPRAPGTRGPAPKRLPPARASVPGGTASRAELLRELAAQGIKHTPENVMAIERIGGRIVFLEAGNARAGLTHIIERHGADFARRGISRAQLPKALMTALSEGRVVGQQGTRPIYEFVFHGKTQRVAITVGDNGFIVGANPAAF
jgi:hypothetical protein